MLIAQLVHRVKPEPDSVVERWIQVAHLAANALPVLPIVHPSAHPLKTRSAQLAQFAPADRNSAPKSVPLNLTQFAQDVRTVQQTHGDLHPAHHLLMHSALPAQLVPPLNIESQLVKPPQTLSVLTAEQHVVMAGSFRLTVQPQPTECAASVRQAV